MQGASPQKHPWPSSRTPSSQDRLNDALNATKAALEGGIVPGGGATGSLGAVSILY